MPHVPHRIPFEHRDRLRDAWRQEHLDPGAVWALAGLEPGMTVADLGAGIGYFAIPSAEIVGESGRVLAIDLSADMLAELAGAVGPGIADRLATVVSDTYSVPLPDACADRAMLGFVTHEVDDPARLCREARRLLRDGGKLLLLEWDPAAPAPPGPPTEARLAVAEVRAALAGAGFKEADLLAVAPGVYGLLAAR